MKKKLLILIIGTAIATVLIINAVTLNAASKSITPNSVATYWQENGNCYTNGSNTWCQTKVSCLSNGPYSCTEHACPSGCHSN